MALDTRYFGSLCIALWIAPYTRRPLSSAVFPDFIILWGKALWIYVSGIPSEFCIVYCLYLQDGVFHFRGNCYTTRVYLGWFSILLDRFSCTPISLLCLSLLRMHLILVMCIPGYIQTQKHQWESFPSSFLWGQSSLPFWARTSARLTFLLLYPILNTTKQNLFKFAKMCGSLQTPGVAE